MDLGAHAQIEKLSEIAEKNGINVERLRGYRLMKDEEPWTEEEMADALNNLVADYWWSRSDQCDPDWFDHKVKDYRNGYRPPVTPKGMFKEIALLKGRFANQSRCWNKYAGQDGVLYIHSRCGEEYRKYANEPWFLDGCLDSFDPTYCDIFAKIDVKQELTSEEEKILAEVMECHKETLKLLAE